MVITEHSDVQGRHAAERRAQIVELVMADGKVLVSDLVKRYNITETSIRRDLMVLEADHRLKRVHGGAVSMPGNFRTDTFVEKAKLHIQAKESIGKAAAGLIAQRNVLLLASGTTTIQVVRHIPPALRTNNLITLVTTSIPIAQEVLAWPSPNLTVLGGLYLPDYQATIGPQAIELLKDITADVAFLGADGLTLEGGATTANVLIAEVDRMMVERARKAVLVVDSSKIGQAGFVPIKPLDSFSVLITDSGASPDFLESARRRGVEVIITQ
jgi:DeoR family transcriptional regulator, aga operon transcriptional repressor